MYSSDERRVYDSSPKYIDEDESIASGNCIICKDYKVNGALCAWFATASIALWYLVFCDW